MNASFPSCAGTGDDPWYPWDGCSAIAGAMVHGYWVYHGYGDLPSGEDNLIDWNHYCMMTSDSGVTMPWYIDDGIRDIFASFDYGDDFDVNNDSGTNWADITGQVDANQPAVLSLSGGSLSGHSVTIVGYQENGTQYVIMHNTWDTSNHTLAYGDWTVAQITKVEENP